MPSFGHQSRQRLREVHPDLRRLFEYVVEEFDCTIIAGFRGKSAQDRAVETGRSKLPWPDGKHNSWPSRAIDVAPWPLDWTDKRRFDHFAGYVKCASRVLRIPIRWGGDWDGDFDPSDQKFNDLVHFELEDEVLR